MRPLPAPLSDIALLLVRLLVGVVLVAHGHLLRILTTVWLREQPRFGAKLSLDAGSVSELGEHHDVPTIDVWNRVT